MTKDGPALVHIQILNWTLKSHKGLSDLSQYQASQGLKDKVVFNYISLPQFSMCWCQDFLTLHPAKSSFSAVRGLLTRFSHACVIQLASCVFTDLSSKTQQTNLCQDCLTLYPAARFESYVSCFVCFEQLISKYSSFSTAGILFLAL